MPDENIPSTLRGAAMKKMYFALILAFVLLFGCMGGEQNGELKVIPEKASGYIIIKPSQLLSDPEVLKTFKGDDPEKFDANLEKVKQDVGIDLYSIQKVTMFLKLNDDAADTEQYGGIIIFGGLDRDKSVATICDKSSIQKEEYEGTTIYKIENIDLNTGQQNPMNAIAFLNKDTAVLGSDESVKDTIDVKNGKKKALSDPRLDKAENAVDKNAVVYAAFALPSKLMQKMGEQKSTGPIDTSSLSKLTHVAFSYNKAGSNMGIRMSMLFTGATDAEKTKDVLNGLVSLGKGMMASGSAGEKILKSVALNSNDDTVTASLDITKELYEQFQAEMKHQTPASP
jgi:hypothetical protein